MSVTSWFLVSSSSTRHRLPREMIFVGREDCELMLQSRSVDKQHAVINYDPATDQHLVKDLGSLNGTFVNDLRIPDQTYVTLKLSDVIRFGYDSHVYVLERSQHQVPEEALKHEKYTSHLQMGLKASEGKRLELLDGGSDSARSKQERSDRRAQQDPPVSRPTPLYGQPSWWGEDDAGNKVRHEGRRPDEGHPESPKESSGLESDISASLSDYPVSQGKSIYSYGREPSYFEIPTKEFQPRPKSPDGEVQEIPTKDTDALPLPTPTLTSPTPPVVQSHASFTIEFDDCRPGKIKIKDHVTKFSSRQHKLPKKLQVTTPTEVMSAESKVADWLVHGDISMMRRRTPCEDVCSTKSDLAMHIKTLKGHHHDDGTQSDSEDPILKGKQSKSQQPIRAQQTSPPPRSVPSHEPAPPRQLPPRQLTPPTPPAAPEAPCRSPPESGSPPQSLGKPPPQELHSQQAFIIEFFDDNPRKKRSQSFTHNSAHADSYSALKAKLERRKGAEKPVLAAAGQIPPTQQVTIPLKGHGHSAPQRASSLHRERTDDRLASGSASSITIKPFGSVGKNSKLAQEFAAEFLKETGRAVTPTREKSPPPPMSAPPVMDTPSHIHPLSPPQPTSASHPSTPFHPPTPAIPHPQPSARTPTQAPSPIHAPVPTLSPLLPLGARIVDPKTSKVRGEEEDSLSDAGTYTIETESQDKEVEEARNMIDQVFGVLDSPEYSGVTYRPVINEGDLGSPRHRKTSPLDLRTVSPQGFNSASLSGAPTGPPQLQVDPPCPASQGGPKWVSRWASLADSYSDTGPIGGSPDTPPQGELADGDGRIVDQLSQNGDGTEFEGSQASRIRRLLPQVPPSDKSEIPATSVHVRQDPYKGGEAPERGTGPPLQQDELDPDSLSDASRSDDGSLARRIRGNQECGIVEEAEPEQGGAQEDRVVPAVRSTSFYIGSDQSFRRDLARSPVLCPSERDQDPAPRAPPVTVPARPLMITHEPRKPVKPNASAPNLQARDREPPSVKEPSIIRQESFTKDRPSNDVQLNRLPHISSHPALTDLEHGGPQGGERGQDPQFLFRATRLGATQGHAEDSLSGESDVDTASTVSLVSSKNAPASVPKKRAPAGGAQKDRASSGPSARQPTARERLSEKRRAQVADAGGKAEPPKRFSLRRSAGNRGSLDLSEEPQHLPASASSDHESSSRSAARKKTPPPPQKEDKSAKSLVQQALTRSNSLSAPRPTRASLLRRARLGEASDTEGTETDRASQGSDAGAPGRPPGDGRKLSRLDVLAMPRRRSGSFTAPSDTESSGGKTPVGPARKAPPAEPKPGPAGRQPIIRARSSSAKYPSTTSSRRRPKGSDYTSTSEEEYEASTASVKHKRTHASAATQTPSSQRPALGPALAPPRAAPRKTEEEEEEEPDSEVDPYQHWSTHSAEIARLSQDLAKDLAILAREIHDVAGDGDSQCASAMATTPSTPASTISAREELVQLIPEASLNYQKVPPGSEGVKDPDTNMNDQDPSSKRRPWSREEVILDNLMLNPVSQLSQAIRENTEQLAEKMKALFHNKTEVWEEIEAKINAENEVPILKTSNKEITSILKELRRVQKQLEVINTIIEPGAGPEAALKAAAGKTRPSAKESRPPPHSRRGVSPGTSSSASISERAKGSAAVPDRGRFAV
ncbi:centrosomal protein of 170 kDa protein B-like [Megalops cyprinoides]|uniref:centrosomal protein of 170 kDa protein B-like n=1 Tax=Megalops cyprinoides TaxID=118141 RepID=UPI001864E0AF|nr:centrosomal protein of 170 kDa protein B-like [Megalops cyprinoides]